MIHDMWPTKVLVKDVELTDEELAEMNVAIEAVFASHQALSGDHKITGEDSMPLFTEENCKVFPIIQKIKDIFADGFHELGGAYNHTQYGSDEGRNKILEMMENHAGRLPIMRKGDYKGLHSHPGAIAFGIFYLTDVDNDVDGGKLILHDPSFGSNPGFRASQKQEIETKAGRLVIAPNEVWHEVTPYYGDQDRITVVSNLSLNPEDMSDGVGADV